MKKWTASHLIALGVLGTDVLATCWVLYVSRLAVRLNFTGSLPYLTALVGALQAATAVVLAAYFNKSRAENTRGGIVYDSALGRNGDWDAYGGRALREVIGKRLGNLLSVKSLVTLTLTAVFAVMALRSTISQDFMTVYAVVIAFYFGTQSQKVQEALDGGGQ